jgi:hypothetical protein
MYQETVKPDYTSIESIIIDTENKKLMLPEFQRPFVWTLEQSKDLFDSLIRGIFIGTFVIAKPQFDLYCRAIDVRPRSGKGSRAKIDHQFYKANEFESQKTLVVLDGQQRITSLSRVLKGYDKIYFVFKKPNDLPPPNTEIFNIEQIVEDLSVKIIDDAFCISLNDVYRCASWKDKEIKKIIFDPIAENYDYLQSNPELSDRYLDLLLDLKTLFFILVKDKTLLSVFFLNMGIEKFCMFFERSNSRGTELSFIDIITAKIYKNFNLDRNINEFREKNKKVFFDNSIVEAFVRYFSFLKAGQVDRKTILSSLEGRDFVDNWAEVSNLYVKSCNFLLSQKLLYKLEALPYKTMFIPIIHFLKNLPHKDFSQITASQMKLFKFWFWGSLLNTRYGGGMVGSTNDIIVDDCKKLENITKNLAFPKEYLKQFKFDYTTEDFIELTSNGAIFTGIISIMNNNKNSLKNLGNNNDIDFSNSINIHHIFPTKYLEKNFDEESFENENSDSILNKMITEKIPNIKFGEKKPSTYLKELTENKNLGISLRSHCIEKPEKLLDGTYDNSYKDFLYDRAKSINDILIESIGNVKSEFLAEIEAKHQEN